MSQQFKADLNELHEIVAFVKAQAVLCIEQEFAIYQIELAVVEAIVNIISYAYEGKAGGIIEIECISNELNEFTIIIVDAGIPFNPLILNSLDQDLDVNYTGGFGVVFMMKSMDEIKYWREEDKNHLKLVKVVI